MKSWFKTFLAALLFSFVALGARAQQQPVVAVEITRLAIGAGPLTGPPNELAGPYGTPIQVEAVATGTFLQGSFVYTFFVNGIAIGTTPSPVPPGIPAVVSWTPPQPGSYFIHVAASDGGTPTATSLPVRYFATGTVVNSPVTNTLVPQGSSVVLKADATVGQGFVRQIQFFDNGVPIGSPDTTIPYSFIYAVPGAADVSHNITAQATTNRGDLLAVSPAVVLNVVPAITPLPTSAISTPANGSVIPIPAGASNTPIAIVIDAHSPTGLVSKVELYIDGVLSGTKTTFPYTFNWTPTVVGTYRIVGLTYDDKNNVLATSISTVLIAAPPSVAVTTPANGSTVTGGSPTQISATATDSNTDINGVPLTITSVQFFVDGNFVGQSTSPAAAPAAPNTFTTTATLTQKLDEDGNPEPSVITALATNSGGLTGVSAGINVNVTNGGSSAGSVIGLPPTATVTSPKPGTVLGINRSVAIAGTANDPDGTIASVQFFVNKQSVGTTSTFPYTASWTPTSLGNYAITMKVTDSDGNSITSSEIAVYVVDLSLGDTTATGIIVGPGENGTFTVIKARGQTVTFIGVTTVDGVSKTHYYPSIPLASNGTFNSASSTGQSISGTFSETGAFGTLENGRLSFSGAVTFPGIVTTIAPGYYTGNISGRLASTVTGVVGPDGSIAIYVSDGAFQAAGFGSVDSTGVFSITTNNAGARIVGRADPTTGFLTGTITGGPGGSIVAASGAGISASDGFLRNLSTRGQVGTGDNVLIAGFVVGGTVSKRIMVRAIGPSLTQFGVTGALADPQLQVVNSANVSVTQNDNWETPVGSNAAAASAMSDAAASVGAFGLTVGSRDSVVLLTLPPGSYTAKVNGASGGTGIALVEVWDIDSPSPFSAQKVLNVSTRGIVGTGQAQLIAGFVVSGNTAKKVLIRAVGPSLASVGIASGVLLADPVLRLVRRVNNADITVRENDNWAIGNDSAQVTDAASKVGAFALAAGSRDAVILINLPPGIYTAQVTGTGTTTGMALAEVYEVP